MAGLSEEEWAQALFHLDLLESRGVNLGFPYTSQLDGKLRKLRFYCGGRQVRISSFITGARRIIMLTVFYKTSRRESAEVRRAKRAMETCVEAGHTADEEGP
ncbi:type II toxin-antitoxin system RelE/ParE family toxin [Nocardiopsis valliformis]|uniref:type II toxin-antitoxin system RelE/ParE family toxin n=1 Tax=Nocardiopsis valliformis TaxID=239974 RepID=UPI0023A94A37|nr:type II toxin-antitoxin system RelE/ParE family toxin [Nocardiopsis valliformis]